VVGDSSDSLARNLRCRLFLDGLVPDYRGIVHVHNCMLYQVHNSSFTYHRQIMDFMVSCPDDGCVTLLRPGA